MLQHKWGEPCILGEVEQYLPEKWRFDSPSFVYYLEGIRAHILDKDDQPRWQPSALDEVPPLGVT